MNMALNTVGPPAPTTFAAWVAGGKRLFPDGDAPTTTHMLNVVMNGKVAPDRRRAVGWCGRTFRFYIEMNATEAVRFEIAWERFAATHGGDAKYGGPHAFLSDAPGQGPRSSGPPNGPPC